MAHEVLIPPKVAAEIEAIGDWIAQGHPAAAERKPLESVLFFGIASTP